MKAGVAKAADSTSRSTKSLAVKSSISSLKGNIDDEKKKFGLAAFDLMENKDTGAVEAAFAASKAKIDALKEQLAKKEQELEALKVPKAGGAPADGDGAAGDAPAADEQHA